MQTILHLPARARLPWRRLALGSTVLALGLLATGCAQSYTIVTTSGGTLYSRGRPKLVGGYYQYKDSDGQIQEINSLRVRAIEVQ